MVKALVVIGIFISFLTATIPLYANKYQPLQEKCTEQAKKFVEHLDTPTTYTCHYNKRLKKCFLCVQFNIDRIKLRGGKTRVLKHPQRMVVLYDVPKGKMIGNCTYVGIDKQECWVRKTKCKTKDEFEKLIRPYMEE